MMRLISIILLALFVFSCSPSNKKDGESKAKTPSAVEDKNKPNEAPESSLEEGFEGDRYRLVISYINNRAVVYMSDSLVYDSETVDGEVNVEVELTPYVESGMTNLKVEMYNGTPPYNTASPDWKVAYDIFINDQLVEFVTEESKDGKIGLVHTENHDLSDLW